MSVKDLFEHTKQPNKFKIHIASDVIRSCRWSRLSYTLNTVYRAHTRISLNCRHWRMARRCTTVSLSVCVGFYSPHSTVNSNKLIESSDTCQQQNNQWHKQKNNRILLTVHCLSIWMRKWYRMIKYDNITPDVGWIICMLMRKRGKSAKSVQRSDERPLSFYLHSRSAMLRHWACGKSFIMWWMVFYW